MKNEYTVSRVLFFKRFKESRSDRARIGSLAVYVLFTVYFAGWAIFGIIKKVNVLLIVSGFLISLFSLFIALFGDRVAIILRHKKAAKIHKAERWPYTAVLGENITVTEGKKTHTYEYSDVVKVYETSGDGVLVLSNGKEIRLRKNKFVDGDWKSCKAFFESR